MPAAVGWNWFNTIQNRIDANIVGTINVNAIGDMLVKANQTALIEADASNVTVAVSLGAALGVSLVEKHHRQRCQRVSARCDRVG